MKIGLIREEKQPTDRRVPLTPAQCKEVKEKFPQVEIYVQPSSVRCFPEKEYEAAGAILQEDLSNCDTLLGVKEVPIPSLIPEKTYFFFSHTIKEQEYNRNLLRAILEKKISLVDYEVLTDEKGKRVIAFGRYAGIVGAYNGLWTWGKRFGGFALKRANECLDLEELHQELKKVKLPAIRMAVTGAGRVAQGAWEVLDSAGIRRVSAEEFLANENFDEAVYAVLKTKDYNRSTNGTPFDLKAFYADPTKGFEGDFRKYLSQIDLLIAGAYWDMRAPVLFDKEYLLKENTRLKVIADITCDIEGSIPSTKKPSTIADPIYDYSPSTDSVETPLSAPENLTVMAVDNLPCELPRDASNDFGRMLIDEVLPNFLGTDEGGMMKRATVTNSKGELTANFEYLKGYVEGA